MSDPAQHSGEPTVESGSEGFVLRRAASAVELVLWHDVERVRLECGDSLGSLTLRIDTRAGRHVRLNEMARGFDELMLHLSSELRDFPDWTACWAGPQRMTGACLLWQRAPSVADAVPTE